MPSLRDPDGYIYIRRDIEGAGGLLLGGFEPVAKPWGMDGIPEDFAAGMLNRDWSHYMIFMENAIERVPAMEDAEVLRTLVGPEAFTPDNNYILGEAPELRNFFVAAGFNSSGIASAAGAGRAVAEWIVEGEPTRDLWEVDINRFQKFQNGGRYLHDRTVEGLGLLYALHWPNRQNETARHVRRSPFYERLAAHGACFGAVAGWERPEWYAPEGVEPKNEYSYRRQNWFPYSALEHRAVREAVGLFDQTSFAKFLMQGRDSERALQHICANNVAVPPGQVVYTAMLNERGGIETDLTVTRIADERYLIVTSAPTAARDFKWIEDNIPDGSHCFLTDVTSAYAVLGVMGPRSRELLSLLSDDDLSDEAFPYLTSREIDLGYAHVRASRVTYVGELGWELYIPTEFAVHVYDAIVGEGDSLGLRHAGFHAMSSLRMEKAYRAWGHDITDQDTPLEAGLGFAVALDRKNEFIGREALLRQREQGLTRRMAVFTFDDPEPLLLGDEPVYRDGVLVGRVTSGAYGHTLGRSVGMGYVESAEGVSPKFIRAGTYEIEVFTQLYPVSVGLRPPYDPGSARVKA
jgi:4-methylaminobutanoate oxidase (formaldehyde-forming)